MKVLMLSTKERGQKNKTLPMSSKVAKYRTIIQKPRLTYTFGRKQVKVHESNEISASLLNLLDLISTNE